MHLVPILCCLVASPLAAAQGGSFTTAQNVELPTTSAYDADHATVAINSLGDVFVAYSAMRTDLAVGAYQVEGCYMRYLGNNLWSAPVMGVSQLVLAAADAHVFGPGFESSRKPDVMAVGADFYVTWPRANADRTLQRLEGVRIVPDGVGGIFIDRESPGVGFVLDAQVDGSSAGIMPDLVEIPGYPLGMAVVYVDDESQSPPQHEYDLRYLRADFSVVPPLIDGPYVIENNITYDDLLLSGEPSGGKILPDAVRDDLGNLVVAYESYVRSGHEGSSNNEGRVVTSWYQDPGATQPIRLGTTIFHGATLNAQTRRPNLSASRLDLANSVSLAYLYAPDGSSIANVGYYELTWNGSSITSTNLNYPNSGNTSDSMPVPVHGSTLRICFADRGALSNPKLMSYLKSINGRLMTVGTAAKPWRPAAEIMEPAPPGSGASIYVPLTYEAPHNGTGPLRIFLQVSRL